MSSWEERSASKRSTEALTLLSLISARAASPLPRSRPTITTLAPMLASSMAVALPMPEVAPVMRQTFSPMEPFMGFLQDWFGAAPRSTRGVGSKTKSLSFQPGLYSVRFMDTYFPLFDVYAPDQKPQDKYDLSNKRKIAYSQCNV